MRTLCIYFTILTTLLSSLLSAQDDIIFNRDAMIKSTEKLTIVGSKGMNIRYGNGSSGLSLTPSESKLFASSKSYISAYSGVFLSSYSKINLSAFIPAPNKPSTTMTLSPKAIGINMEVTPSTIGSIDLSTYKLFVNGGVLAKEVRVRTDWADYVFDPSYSLLSLREVENFIRTNGHLPNVPNATTVAEEGIEIGNMTRIQQEKIEELTLYTIQLYKENQAQQAIIKDMQERLTRLEATSKN